MDNIEIILEDFRKDELDNFAFNELKINMLEVKSSHFFDNSSDKDIELYQIKSLGEVLSPIGTGNVLLNQIDIGCSLKDVMIVFSFDKETGDITFNFSKSELFEGKSSEVRMKTMRIVKSILGLKGKYNIPKIRIGFEPVSDDDSCLVGVWSGYSRFRECCRTNIEIVIKTLRDTRNPLRFLL